MKCKTCKNEALEGFSYCNRHLCNKTKRDGTRCKNKKFKGKDYCFPHTKYIIGNKIGLWGIVIGIIIALIAIFFGNKLYYLVWGDIHIDFKENPEDITYMEGKPYARIEVLNELGRSLQNIKGTITITCADIGGQITSRTFKLPENREFLPHNQVDFLIAHDQLFIDIINTRKDSCSDATLVSGKYKKINKTHGKLSEVILYEFFNDKEPIKINCGISSVIKANTCLYCDITTEIYASNKNKKFSKTETHKFIGFQTIINPFNDIIKSGSMGDPFYMFISGYFSSFKLCNGVTKDECHTLLCNEVKKLGLDISCQEGKDRDDWSFPPFTTGEINPPDSCE